MESTPGEADSRVAAGEAPEAESEAKMDVVCRVSFVAGDEISLDLPGTVTCNDLYAAVGEMRGVPSYLLKLIPTGHLAPLKRSKLDRLVDVMAGGPYELMAVASGQFPLGDGPFAYGTAEKTAFDHHAATAYLAGISEVRPSDAHPEDEKNHEIERFEGILVSFTSGSEARGIIFNTFEGAEVPALEGRVLLRFMAQNHGYALGLGVGVKDLPVAKDPEYQKGFFGLYHGGFSRNCCAFASRYHEASGGRWSGELLAVLIDTSTRTMQCFEGTKPFGPLFEGLPEEPLWPVVIGFTNEDVISVSVSSV